MPRSRTIRYPRRIRYLGFLTLCLVVLLVVHSLLVGNITDYTYMLWNFFLALLPVVLIYPMRYVTRHTSHAVHLIGILVIGFLWLALIPNTFYLLTEFTHLNPGVLVNLTGDQTLGSINYGRGSALYLLDSLMLLIAALFGAYAGSIALCDGYRFIKKYRTVVAARISIAIVMLLIAIGVYIGRYGRWNSWDVIIQPLDVVSDFITQLSHPETFERFIVYLMSIILFEIISLYVFTQLKLMDDNSQ